MLAVHDGVDNMRRPSSTLLTFFGRHARCRQEKRAVPDVAITLKPSENSCLTASRMRALSVSRTETNTVAPCGGTLVARPPSWLLAKATSNERSIAHHLAGGAHLGAEHGIDAGEAGERKY